MTVKGDELLSKANRFLCFLYDRGAIGPDLGVERHDVVTFLEVDEREYDVLKSYLRDARLVEVYQVWVRALGGGRSRSRKVWLTHSGVEKARQLVSGMRRDAGESSKGRIGFPEPGQRDD